MSGNLEMRLRTALMEQLEIDDALNDEEILARIDRLILAQPRDAMPGLEQKEAMRRALFHSVRGLDVIQELVDDPTVTEIMVNGHRSIFVERAGKIRPFGKAFSSEERLEDVIQQIAGRCNRVVNEQRPIADARLANGARVNIVLPPVSLCGPVLTIRRFPDRAITMEDLIEKGSLTEEASTFLRQAVAAGYSILVGGGTSSGKTTFLNALSAFIPREERVVTIEDNAELQLLDLPNLVQLEVRSANLEGAHAITMRDLIKTALRMRPNRIIVGEVRGAEAGDWLTCLNTGHDGSLGSAHANSVRDMVGRLETMVRMGAELPIPVIRRQIAAGIELLVHLGRDAGGHRRVEEIAELSGIERDEIRINTLYGRDESGVLRRKNALQNCEKMHRREQAEQ